MAGAELMTIVPDSMSTPGLLNMQHPEGNGSVDDLIHPYWRQWDIEQIIPDSYHYAVACWMTFFGILGTLGNLLVIYTFITTKSLRTAPNMLVVNLAISDMTFSAINGFPLLTISSINKKWVWGKLWCQLYAFVGGIMGFCSINTLTWIAIDRYYVITQPLTAAVRMTKGRTMIILGIIWFWASLWSLPPFFGWGAYVPEGFQTSCTFDYLSKDISNMTFNIGMYFGGFLIPVFIIFYCYIGIVKGVFAHHSEMMDTAKRMGAQCAKADADRRAEFQLAKVAAMTIGTFLLSWVPYASVGLLGMTQPWEAKAVTPMMSEIAVMFAKASAAYNPVIYALSHPKFRAEIDKNFPFLLLFCKPKPKATLPVKDLKKQASVMSSASGATETENMHMSPSHSDDHITDPNV